MNLVFGMISLMNSGRGCPAAAAWCLLGSEIMDAADGYLARRRHVVSEFGANLDSLADMASFNIAGAVLTFYWFSPQVPPYLMGTAAVLYSVLGACRLARFNISPKNPDEFQGIPTTGVAVMVAVAHLASPGINAWMGMCCVVLLSVLMVSPFPYPKTPRLLRCPVWLWVALLLTAQISFPWAVWGSIVLYVLSGPAIWLRRRGQHPPTEDWQVHRHD